MNQFEVNVSPLDGFHEERELRVHLAVEALVEGLAEILAHLGVAFDPDAGPTSEQECEIVRFTGVVETIIDASVTLFLE